MTRREERSRESSGRRRALLLALALAFGLSGVFACATRGPGSGEGPASERARPIDLSPRCIVFEPLAESFAPLSDSARSRRLGPTLEIVVMPGPAADPAAHAGGLQRLRWVTPVSAFASPTHARATFFLWSLGELSADPVALRQRLRARGIALSTARLGDRVVLDLVFPASELGAALAAWRTLMAPEAIAPERLESIRRELALLLLAEEAAPDAGARRLRRALRAGEPDPGAKSVLDELDGESLRDALLGALQSGSVETGHLLIYSAERGTDLDAGLGAGALADLGVALGGDLDAGLEAQPDASEAALDRLEEEVASWPGPGRSSSTATSGGARAEAGEHARREPETAKTKAGGPTTPEAAGDGAPAIHLLDQPGARQVELLATTATVGRGATDFAALEMLASLLGDPLGGRLFRDLRERQGLAYEIGAQQTAEGELEVSTRTRPERLGALMAGIEAHWAALKREPIEACELAMLRERMDGLLALEADEPTARLDGLTRSWAGPGSPLGLAGRAEAYHAVSRETLERVGRQWLGKPPEWLLVGDASRVVPRLREAFPDRRVVVHDASLEITRELGGP